MVGSRSRLWTELNAVTSDGNGDAADAVREAKTHAACAASLDECFADIVASKGLEWRQWEVDFVFRWLHYRHRHEMEGFACLALCRQGWRPTRDDIEEVVQHVSGVGLYAVIRNFDCAFGNFLSYLHSTFIYYGKEWVHSRERLYFPGDEELLYLGDKRNEYFSGGTDQKILLDQLVSLMAGASPELREVCEMLRGGRALVEIATSLGIRPATLSMRLRRAIDAMQSRIIKGETK